MAKLKRESGSRTETQSKSREDRLHPDSSSGDSGTQPSDNVQQSVVVIIPAYNESDTISNSIQQSAQYVDDVLVINDASTDDTEEVAREHADGIRLHNRFMSAGESTAK